MMHPVKRAAAALALVASLGACTAHQAVAQSASAVPAPTSCSTVDTDFVPDRVPLTELRERFAAPDDRYVSVKGVELRYRDEGTGPVLLLLHGSRSTLNAWDGVADHLKDRYRIIRFDMPPTGLSGPVSDEAMAAIGSPEALVAGFLDALGVQKANVMGVSSGGTLGYYFSATYPTRVENLILSNTPSNPVPGLRPATPADLQAASARAGENGVEGLDFWCAYLGSLWGDRSRLSFDFVRYYYETNLREEEENPRGLYALTANNDTTMARLAAVTAPTLIIWGMKDYVLLPQEGRDLERYLAQAQTRSFIALESVGHYPPMESPEAVADIADAYIRRNR
jgi:pimeloyl-ACP methyl ester carboxylesterase